MATITGWSRRLVVAGVALGTVVAVAQPSFARKPFMERIRKVYTLDKAINNCKLCHALKAKEEPSEDNLNAFAKALQKEPAMKPALHAEKTLNPDQQAAFDAALKAIEGQDSDGDGVLNKDELEKGSNPGDPASKPAK